MKLIRSFDPKLKATDKLALFDQQVVIRVTKFEEAAGKEFSVEMQKAHDTGQPVIPVVIDSFGGECDSLVDMISQIQNANVPVATIVEGKAMSCGAMLFAMGTPGYRFIARDARLMLHDLSKQTWGKIAEVKADAEEGMRLQRKIFGMVERNCGLPYGYLRRIIHDKSHADWYLNAKQVMTHKLADFIGVPELRSSLVINHEFQFSDKR